MDIAKGFQITKPELFIPWGSTETELRSTFGKSQLREVTNGYLTTSCVSFRNLNHELGFHFNPRNNGRLGMLEFFRKKREDLDKSFREFQQHFVGEFGLPHMTEDGSDGYAIHRWQFDHIHIEHTIIDRFGPEEHMRISNLVYRMDPKVQFKKFFVFELNETIRSIIPLDNIGTDESGWRQYFKNSAGNWIKFYPYSELHGGGQPYIILLGDLEPNIWLQQNEALEDKIRAQLEKVGS